jgi:hypothetical protein
MAGFGSYVEFDSEAQFATGGVNIGATMITSCRLTDTLVVSAYLDDTPTPDEGYLRACSLSGTVITAGSAYQYVTSSSIVQCVVERLSDTHFIIAYKDGNDDGYLRVGSVSGTTITMGSAYLFLDQSVTGINSLWNGLQITYLESNKVLVGMMADKPIGAGGIDNGYYLIVANITGTTVSSVGSLTLVQTGFEFLNISMDALDSTHVAIGEARRWGTSTSFTDIWTVIATISGSAVSLGTAVSIRTSSPRPYGSSLVALTSSVFVVTYTDESDYLYGRRCSVSGTTITRGSETVIRDYSGAANLVAYHNSDRISDTRYLIGYAYYNSGLAVGYPNITIVDDIGGTLTHKSTVIYPNTLNLSQVWGTVVAISTNNSTDIYVQFCDFVSPYAMRAVMYANPPDAVKILGMSMGKGAGAKMYVTAWSAATSELVLLAYNVPAMTQAAAYSLGSATLAQVEDKEYLAYPLALLGDDNGVVVFGRMNNPAGLGDPVHMMYTGDGGAIMILMENGFGDDHVGAVFEDSLGFVYAARNISGNSPKIYTGIPAGGLSLLSTPALNGGIAPHSLTMDFNDNLIAAVDAGNTVMIMYSIPPYVAWDDFTFNHGTAAGISAISVL